MQPGPTRGCPAAKLILTDYDMVLQQKAVDGVVVSRNCFQHRRTRSIDDHSEGHHASNVFSCPGIIPSQSGNTHPPVVNVVGFCLATMLGRYLCRLSVVDRT